MSDEELFRASWQRTNRIIRHSMVANGIPTERELAGRLGMTPKTLSSRMTLKTPWTHEELCRAVRVLKISNEQSARLTRGAD